jgi:hypothetical protein
MSELIIRKYKCRCAVDNKWVEIWSEQPPTVCPENSAHAIIADLTVEIDQVSKSVLKIQEESVATGGHIGISTINIDVLASDVGAVSSFPITWENIQTSVMGMTLAVEEFMRGDFIDVYFTYRRPIGALATTLPIGSTQVPINPAVMHMIFVGCKISLFDGVSNNELGQIKSLNAISNTAELSFPTTVEFGPGTGVLLTVHSVRNYRMGAPGQHIWGGRVVGGMAVPPDTTVLINYTNNSGLAKKVTISVEYLY